MKRIPNDRQGNKDLMALRILPGSVANISRNDAQWMYKKLREAQQNRTRSRDIDAWQMVDCVIDELRQKLLRD